MHAVTSSCRLFNGGVVTESVTFKFQWYSALWCFCWGVGVKRESIGLLSPCVQKGVVW